MPGLIDDWLHRLQRGYSARGVEANVLWPNTPLDGIQTQIEKFQGASDLKWVDPRSRPYKIEMAIQQMIAKKLLPRTFAILDLCCGDALVLAHIARKFPDCRPYGIDIHKFRTHDNDKLSIHYIPLQEIISSEPPVQIDIVMMLNTFRGWESARLKPEEAELPEWTEEWIGLYAKRAILTATHRQIASLKGKGWTVAEIGPGEQGSRLTWAWRPK